MPFIDQVTQLLEVNYLNPDFNYKRLCELMQLSRSHIHRQFKANNLGSPSVYIRRFRLKKAKVLLIDTNASITQIVFAVGYTSITLFSENFLAEYGLTPREFRKKC